MSSWQLYSEHSTWLLEQIAYDESRTREARADAALFDPRTSPRVEEFDQYMVDLDAKRRIIELCAPDQAHLPTVLALLTLPYAERQGCRAEWLP